MPLKRTLILIFICFTAGYCCTSSRADPHQGEAVKRVLVLCSYHPSYEWAQSVMQGIQSVFDNEIPKVILHFEYMDTKHHPPVVIFELLQELYSAKYNDIAFDAIIASDNNALDFLLAYRDSLFPDTPVIFCGIAGFRDSMLRGRQGFTGILEDYDIIGTIEMALKIHPDTRHIAVVSGVSTSSLIHQSIFYREQAKFANRVTFIDLCRLNPSRLKRLLEDLPDHTIILYMSYYKAPDGSFFSVRESTALVFNHSKRPVYSLWRHTLGEGVLGGMMIDGAWQGRKAAEHALKVINGAPVGSLPVIRKCQASPMFEYRMLRFHNIPKSSLPARAVVINEPQTLYYQYKHLIWAFIAVCGYLSVTIMVLWHNLRRRRKAEMALKASEELHRITMDNILDPVFITDDDGRFVFVCKNITHLLGYTMDEMLAMSNISALLGQHFVDVMQLEKRGEIRNLEKMITDKRGNRHHYLISVKHVSINDGTMLYTFHDITDLKRSEKKQIQLESQLMHAQKMETIGCFAGGIAHDLNNILGAITTCSEIALQDIPPEDPVHEDIHHVLHAASRGKNLIRQILAFSRQQDRGKQPVPVKTVLKECLALLEYVIPSTVDVKMQFPEENIQAWADPTMLHQVIMNLCLNAEQAMKGTSGTLNICIDAVTIPSAEDGAAPKLRLGEYVRISVADTGCGMEESVKKHVFEPFFTTRRKYGGTGLGLSVAHDIVKRDGGAITVDSTPGMGSTFHIYLPKKMKETTPSTPDPAAASLLPGNERILLVDDDADMLYSAKKLLERLGYSVVGHEESLNALESFRREPDAFNLVITDQIMPTMTGLQLAEQLTKYRPDIPVILFSGFWDEQIIDKSEESLQHHGISAFIHKPFSSFEISRLIRKVLHHSQKGQ